MARRLVRRRLSADVPETVRGGAELIVTELVTNAVVHGVGTIRLRLQSGAGLVRGEVIDEGPGFEVDVREHGVEEIGGRGLWLVSSLARPVGHPRRQQPRVVRVLATAERSRTDAPEARRAAPAARA